MRPPMAAFTPTRRSTNGSGNGCARCRSERIWPATAPIICSITSLRNSPRIPTSRSRRRFRSPRKATPQGNPRSGAGIWYFGVWLFAMATWLPLVARIRNIAEHACTSTGEDPFSHARTTLANPIEPLLIAPYWVNFHAEHHLFMYLPCYRLPEAHRLLIEKGLIKRMEVRPGYLDVMRLATSGQRAA